MPPSRPPKRPGDPNVAALLTWFLPGAGHLYIGRTLTGVLGFTVVWGLYWLGLELSHGMGFEFLNKELRGPLAPALAPELGNLSGLLWQSRTYGFGPDFPRVFPEILEGPEGQLQPISSKELSVCFKSNRWSGSSMKTANL